MIRFFVTLDFRFVVAKFEVLNGFERINDSLFCKVL